MKTLKYLLQIFVLISFIGCQKEEIKSSDNNSTVQNLVANSPLAGLVLRVAQNPTSKDNILDGCSCFSVQLPVTVVINSQSVIVTTTAQYQTVLSAINAHSNDDDLVHFNYPITIKFKDFTTRIVANINQLQAIVDNCGEDNDLNEIDCLTVNFPVNVNTYNTSNQIASTVAIQNKNLLYSFVKNLSSNMVSAIIYPISVVNSTGQTVTVKSNVEFEDTIKLSENECNTNNVGGNGNPSFTTFLTSGSWRVTYYLNNNVNQTLVYDNYNIFFNPDKNCTAVKNAVTTNGKWSNSISGGKSKFKLQFDGSVLDGLGKKWEVIEFSSTLIKLKNDDNLNDRFINFTKN